MIASPSPARLDAPPAPAFLARWRWPGIVACLLGAHVTLMIWAVCKATAGNAATVIPDYYARSLKWDETRAALSSSAATGWKAKLDVISGTGELGRRQVRVTLTDAQGKPLATPSVHLTFNHDSHADDPQAANLQAVSPGVFEGDVPLRWAGFHHFSVRATVRGREFLQEWPQFVGME